MRERRPTRTMEPRRHPVFVLICFALVTNSIFAACPTHTGAPPGRSAAFRARLRGFKRRRRLTPNSAFTVATRHRATITTAPTLVFGDNGALVFTDVGYQTREGLCGMPSRYSFGGYVHMGDFSRCG